MEAELSLPELSARPRCVKNGDYDARLSCHDERYHYWEQKTGFILLNDFVTTPDYPLMTPIAMRFSPCGNSRMINSVILLILSPLQELMFLSKIQMLG